MKTISIIATALMLSIFSTSTFAQLSLSKAVTLVPKLQLPYSNSKQTIVSTSYGIINPRSIIPNKLYTDFQCKKYISTDNNPELGAGMVGIANTTHKEYKLGIISFGGATDYVSDVIIILNSKNKISDCLEAGIQVGEIATKQFIIQKDGIIKIYQLIPISSVSIAIDSNFNKIKAEIVEKDYTTNNDGKFTLVRSKNTSARYYNEKELKDLEKNLWNLE